VRPRPCLDFHRHEPGAPVFYCSVLYLPVPRPPQEKLVGRQLTPLPWIGVDEEGGQKPRALTMTARFAAAARWLTVPRLPARPQRRLASRAANWNRLSERAPVAIHGRQQTRKDDTQAVTRSRLPRELARRFTVSRPNWRNKPPVPRYGTYATRRRRARRSSVRYVESPDGRSAVAPPFRQSSEAGWYVRSRKDKQRSTGRDNAAIEIKHRYAARALLGTQRRRRCFRPRYQLGSFRWRECMEMRGGLPLHKHLGNVNSNLASRYILR